MNGSSNSVRSWSFLSVSVLSCDRPFQPQKLPMIDEKQFDSWYISSLRVGLVVLFKHGTAGRPHVCNQPRDAVTPKNPPPNGRPSHSGHL